MIHRMVSLVVILFAVAPAVSAAAGGPQVDSLSVKSILDMRKLAINIHSMYPDTQGAFLLCLDSTGSRILRLSLPLSQNSSIELLAGSSNGEAGYADGPAATALFNHPQSLAIDEQGDVYVADTRNFAIRKISKGQVTTIAGGRFPKAGYADGPAENARFSADVNLAYFRGSLLISDIGNGVIREMQLRPCSSADSEPGFFTGARAAMLLLLLLIPAGVVAICLLALLVRAKFIPRVSQSQVRETTGHFLAIARRVCCGRTQKFDTRSEVAEAVIDVLALVCSLLKCCILLPFVTSTRRTKLVEAASGKEENAKNVIMLQQLESLFQPHPASLPDLINFKD